MYTIVSFTRSYKNWFAGGIYSICLYILVFICIMAQFVCLVSCLILNFHETRTLCGALFVHYPQFSLQISKQILMVDEVYRLHGLPEFYKVIDIQVMHSLSVLDE